MEQLGLLGRSPSGGELITTAVDVTCLIFFSVKGVIAAQNERDVQVQSDPLIRVRVAAALCFMCADSLRPSG